MHRLIDKAALLGPLLDHVRVAPWLALDTEADSLHAYPEKLCLLQLSLPGMDELVDPLAGMDLGPLLEVLRPHRLLVHGGDYDLRLLYRTFAFVPAGVFDTMLAARLLGSREVGLDKLAATRLGVRLEKTSQRANWARRPLTERMAAYARNDTHYLKPLADSLAAELGTLGRLSWHTAWCARLVQDCAQPVEPDPDLVWRLGGANRLERRGLALLRELWRWRDGEARRVGRPPFFVLPHETLLRIAELASRGHAWTAVLPRRLPSAYHAALTATLERAFQLPEHLWPRHERPVGVRLSAAQRARYLRLQDRRDRVAAELRLDPSLIASRGTLVELAGGRLDPERDLLAWQRALLGE